MLLCELCDRLEIVKSQNTARRILRRIDDDHSCARGDPSRHLIKAETKLAGFVERDWNGCCAGHQDRSLVSGIDRSRVDHFVTGIDKGVNNREDLSLIHI